MNSANRKSIFEYMLQVKVRWCGLGLRPELYASSAFDTRRRCNSSMCLVTLYMNVMPLHLPFNKLENCWRNIFTSKVPLLVSCAESGQISFCCHKQTTVVHLNKLVDTKNMNPQMKTMTQCDSDSNYNEFSPFLNR